MPDPVVLPYEQQLVQWGKKKIAAGANVAVVHSLILDQLHAYQEKRAAEPIDTGPETLGDRAAELISSGYQGLTLGAGNKITAGLRVATGEPVSYTEALKENTDLLDQHRRHHPIEAMAAELAGSIPTILATGGSGTGGALSRIATGAAKGAGIGGVAGGAEAIRPDATVDDVERGAGVGATVGGVLGGGIPAVGAMSGLLKGVSPAVLRDVAMSPWSMSAKIRLLTRLAKSVNGGSAEAIPSAVATSAAGEATGAGGVTESMRQALLKLGVPEDKLGLASVERTVKSPVLAQPAESPTARAARQWFSGPKATPELPITPEAKAAFQSKAVETLMPHRPVQLGPDQASVSSSLQDLLDKANSRLEARGIFESSPSFGDSEEAMGLAPHQQPDLEDLLRRSLTLAKRP